MMRLFSSKAQKQGQNMLRSLLQSTHIGFGMLAKGMLDQFYFEDENSELNYVMIALGAYLFLQTTLTEPLKKASSCSTHVIRKTLENMAGFSIVSPVVNMIQGKDRRSANLSNLANAFIVPLALDQLNFQSEHPLPSLPCERGRFYIRLAGDVLASLGMRPIINELNFDFYSVISLVTGFCLIASEFSYGWHHDRDVALTVTLERRSIELVGILNLFFMLQDFFRSVHDRFSYANDVTGLLMGSALLLSLDKLDYIVDRVRDSYDHIRAGGEYEAIPDSGSDTERSSDSSVSRYGTFSIV